jgi:hypothetical protein
MGRDTLLKQKKEKEEALKEISQKYKDPASIKYDLFDEDGAKAGYVEYMPQSDTLYINAGSAVSIEGCVLKSLRDVLNKLLDE